MKSLLGVAISSVVIMMSLGTVAAAIGRSYATNDTDLKQGMMVALVPGQSATTQRVERVSQENQAETIGFAKSVDTNVLNVVTPGQAVVQVDGEGDVYVSDMNGPVEPGTRLVISPIRGVLMRNNGTIHAILAVAQENFLSADSKETKNIETADGQRDVSVGLLRISLDYQVGAEQEPSSLETLGRAVVGKDVTAARVIAALIIFVIVLVVEGSIIYGAVSSAMVALGRNPLARKMIHQEILRVVLIAFIVLLIGLGSAYLILWI